MLGRIKRVGNLDRKQGENHEYLYVKVQLPYGGEEHWLLTDCELQVAEENRVYRGLPEPPNRLGLVALEPPLREGADACAPEDVWYVVRLLSAGPPCPARQQHMLAFDDLERIRTRVENNREDIEANAPGWLADLLD